MTAPIPTTTLGASLRIPRVLTGLWQVADLERDGRTLDRAAAHRDLQAYVDAGFTAFDMADHYGSAEVLCGEVFGGGRRDDVALLTKWVPTPGPLTRDDVRAAVDRACARLQRERIDLLQFHAWRYADPSWLDALTWLGELRDAGRIGGIALTNVDAAHLRVAHASGFGVVSDQVCCSLLDRRALRGVAPYAAAHGIGVLAYGTVAGGFLSDRWLGAPEPDWSALETWSQMKYGRFIREAGGWDALQTVLRAARTVADRHDVSIANVATRWVLDQPGISAVIIGARLGRSEHIAETQRLFAFTLDDADRATIHDALAALTPIPGDSGDEYRRAPYLTASGDLSHHVEAFPSPYPVVTDARGRRRVQSGTTWEAFAGYSRAVRVGSRISVAGSTATHGPRVVGGDDAAAQAHAVIDKIEGALLSLGSSLADVVRTRVFVSDVSHWEPVARAHGERFGDVRPANTLVEAKLVGSEYLVEIEADAIVADD